jgi:hypothetical protein
MSQTRVFLAATTGLFALAYASQARLLAQDAPVSFRATAVNTSDVGRQGMDNVDIAIERWTTDAEFAKMKDALVEKGGDSLLHELSSVKPRVGYIRRTGGGLGWDLRYARKTELASGGYRVVFATDRPMSFAERSTNPRSAEYEFLVGEIRIGRDGKGEGKLVPMASVEYDEESRSIQIENYASEPVRLTQVTEEKRRASAPASR